MKLFRIISIILGSLLCASITYATIYYFSGTVGTPWGSTFHTDNTGNAGTVFFAGNTAQIITGDTCAPINGYFIIETIGKVTFKDGTCAQMPSSGNPLIQFWPVIGSLSSNAGDIAFDDVRYDPCNHKLVGKLKPNNGIGIIPAFGPVPTSPTCSVSSVGSPDDVSVSALGANAGFVGKVKILGAIGGQASYDNLYLAGSKFNDAIFVTTRDTIRKNVALLSRNIPTNFANNFLNPSPQALGNKIFYINNTSTVGQLQYAPISLSFPSSTVASLILIGGDLTINIDIINSSNLPKGIIVLKNDVGVGGNIYITKDVKKIQSSIFAEGSVYSASGPGGVYIDAIEKASALSDFLPTQLYIQGSLISHNTIGGATASLDTAICFYYEPNCTFLKSIQYDLNYFRGYTGATDKRAYTDNSLDMYSLIIELDPRMGFTPPPGFENQ